MRALRALAVVVLVGGCAPKQAPAVSHDIDFKAELSRYGEWIVLRPYGRVWHPHERVVGKRFIPYLTGGHWKYDRDGWEFESEWGWGEYTFHRGRWFTGDDLGWVWLPDQERAASWVEWKVGPDFVGWSPLPPPPPTNVTLPPRTPQWMFVKTRQFTQSELGALLQTPEGVVKALSLTEDLPVAKARFGPPLELIRAQGGLTADGGVPDLTPPPEPVAPAQVVPEEEKKEEAVPPPSKKKKKGKKGK